MCHNMCRSLHGKSQVRNGKERDRSREKEWLEIESERWGGGWMWLQKAPAPPPPSLISTTMSVYRLLSVNGINVHIKVIYIFFLLLF